ncbi:pilus protein [Pseudomonas cichorii]|uniref:Fimbrial protein n=1 Tax=Pseudomonas serbiensis TaxID=3064350 RepID=A0ABT9CTM0_9PSED|nr:MULTISPECIES: fimbrial protein [Pseudomonas]MDO7928841.1 fimbrial protein [Pseudomonas sp. KFB-138]GFM86166.1 pilus protein [Pseudomonas cichorii]
MTCFPANRWLKTLVLSVALSPATGFALVCKTQGTGESAIHGDLSSTVAIPASVPDGDVVWRSERLNIQVECAREGQQSVQQEVFIYLNPDNRVIGQGIRAGLTLDGVDYLQTSGRISTRQYVPVCHEGDSNIGACPKVRFNMAFSVFVQKHGPTPPSGVASDLLDYRMFQLDDAAGLDPVPGRSLSYVINNLSGLRFIACEAQLQVLPETLEFGSLGIQRVEVGKVFARRPFSLLANRSCESPFSLNARFRPVTGRLSGDVLVPGNNNSLGIRIVSERTNAPLRYNELFHLADLLGENQAARVDFNAELLWQTTRPKAGPFEAEVMVDLFYK